MAKDMLANMNVDRDCPYCQGKMRHSRSGRKACKKGSPNGGGKKKQGK